MGHLKCGVWAGTLAVLLLGCDSPAVRHESKDDATVDGAAGASARPVSRDTDADGLCDATEKEVATNLSDTDTDGDGPSDLVELAYGFGPLDVANPAPEQVAVLGGRVGASIDFPVRVTVIGSGEAQAGTFEVGPTVYEDGLTADAFFQAAAAVSGEPLENVRGIDYASERFISVLGETRLAFSLRFQHPAEASPGCIRAYPFHYVVKSSRGETNNLRQYVLVVIPDGTNYDGGPWCGLESCL